MPASVHTKACSIIAAICFVAVYVGSDASAAEKEDAAKDDAAPAITAYLHDQHPGKTWETGPTLIASDPIRKAYPDRAFYYVLTGPKPVARANDPGISTLLSIDAQKRIREVAADADFNDGLSPDADRRVQAVAIMSLKLGPRGPAPVQADEVTVQPDGKTFAAKAKLDEFTVVFADDGKVGSILHRYLGQLPICFGGLFQALSSEQYAALGRHGQGAVEVTHMDPGSVAEQSGMHIGDRIVAFEGRALPEDDPISYLRGKVIPLKLADHPSERRIEVLRDGTQMELTVRWPGQGGVGR